MADEQSGAGGNVVQFRRRPENPVARRMDLAMIIHGWAADSSGRDTCRIVSRGPSTSTSPMKCRWITPDVDTEDSA